MIIDLVRGSGLASWLTEAVTTEAAERGTPLEPALDRLRGYEEELAQAVIAYLSGLEVPEKAARKWLQVSRGIPSPPPGDVQVAQRDLTTFLRVILPQLLYDPAGLRS